MLTNYLDANVLIKTCWIKYNGRKSYMLYKNTASKTTLNISFDGLQKTVLVMYKVFKSMEPRYSKF